MQPARELGGFVDVSCSPIQLAQPKPTRWGTVLRPRLECELSALRQLRLNPKAAIFKSRRSSWRFCRQIPHPKWFLARCSLPLKRRYFDCGQQVGS
jgi:hypothetical protein